MILEEPVRAVCNDTEYGGGCTARKMFRTCAPAALNANPLYISGVAFPKTNAKCEPSLLHETQHKKSSVHLVFRKFQIFSSRAAGIQTRGRGGKLERLRLAAAMTVDFLSRRRFSNAGARFSSSRISSTIPSEFGRGSRDRHFGHSTTLFSRDPTKM